MDSFSTTSQEDSEMESDDSGGRLRNLTDLPPFMSDIIECCQMDDDYVPPWSQMLTFLKHMDAELRVWINFALEYENKGDIDGYVNLLESAQDHSNLDYQTFEEDLNRVRDMLVVYYTTTANDAYQENDIERALSYYKKGMKCNPNSSYIRVFMARCLLRLHNLYDALFSYLEAIRIDDKCICALLGVATIHLQIGNMDEGEEYLCKAYTVDRTNPMVLNQVADYSFTKKLYKQSIQLAKNSLDCTNNVFLNSQSYYILGRTYHVKGDYDKAFEYYYRASEIAPEIYVLPLFGLGKMYIHKGDKEMAIECFEKILKHQPTDMDVLKILGFLYVEDETNYERINKGKSYFKQVVEKCPKDHEAWLKLAEVCSATDPRTSLKAYHKALDLINKSADKYIPPSVLNNVAVLHFKFKNFHYCRQKMEESLTVLNEVVFIDNERRSSLEVTITYNLARVYEELQDNEIAQKLYQFIIEDYPDYIDGYLRLGVIAHRTNKITEAYQWYQRALKVDRGNTVTLHLIQKLQLTINSRIHTFRSIPTNQIKILRCRGTPGKSTDTPVSLLAIREVEPITHANESQVNKNQSIELKTTIPAINDNTNEVGSIENPFDKKKSSARKDNPPKSLKKDTINL